MSAPALSTALPAPAPPAPMSSEQADLLRRLTDGLDGAGLWFLSGYAAGLARGQTQSHPRPIPIPTTAVDAPAVARLTVVYGSQTGNARRLAEALAQQVEAAGLPVRLLRADAYATRELKDETHLAIVISTQGDGDPPDDARALVEFITGKRAPALPALRYAVFGLGDSSYPQFCAIGRRLDARLAELGAQPWLPRVDADLDVETPAGPWIEQLLTQARDALRPGTPPASVTPLRPHVASVAVHRRDQPFHAQVLANQRITGRGSDRDVRHVELSLDGAGLHYEPGDALGVWPVNPPALVEAVLDKLGLDGNAAVAHAGDTLPLCEWLSRRRELTRLSRPFVAAHAAHARSEVLNRLLAPDQATAFAQLLNREQLIDLLRAHPAAWSADELVAALRPLAPRLYSIASSRKHVGDEAHLTVAHVEYAVDGDPRWGAASHFLASRADGERVPVFVEANERFRLPGDPARDVVMIGPGTGVAPFRGFVQERAAIGASGRHWLLFGNPHARSDFLYQLEWQDALRRGQLHRLDLAFSRDRTPAHAPQRAHSPSDAGAKVYVQHRLREHGRTLFDWLESGAHLYVCGAVAMGRDVHATLLDVVRQHGGRSDDDAADYLNALQAQGRYARDVY
ncbi:assimilatory sulfite reductase (NADPH) flavoprotein subunit [Cognatilysobacter tabacisoli]|uniref:assimilatory sulfite reductase (NADPH) flavoprotein subunit n=1 Tax=Cognatilysobacter tabacisoli TaxID=2315424 RepID=UPI001E3D5F16|nr:assimilatory sulfite reductase (NADPH) flavoprotein subunit [Lysobacter tabacisoli]